jgi:hypothetical protein
MNIKLNSLILSSYIFEVQTDKELYVNFMYTFPLHKNYCPLIK